MRFLSVCSGIDAASQAWDALGWQCAGFSEIEPFPRAVLQDRYGAVPVEFDNHRYSSGQNSIPLFDDFTKIEAHHVGAIDILVGGTPCQSFSIAGKRAGLDDPRGNLTLEFFALVKRIRPRWIIWENVPGVLSDDEGRTFGTVLSLMGECGFRWAYRILDAQFARVERFGRAVPQRRRRLFLVGCSGAAGINPAAVLFERESLRGSPAPRRAAGERTAATVKSSTEGGNGHGTGFDCDKRLVTADMTALGEYGDGSTASTVKARDFKDATDLVAYSHRREGFNSSKNGTVLGSPIGPSIAFPTEMSATQSATTENLSPALAVTHTMSVADDYCVRRLTPRECERLMGFPDDFTKIAYRNKSASECPNGPRYKALGNSMAVNCMTFIGERIGQIEAALKQRKADNG